MDFDDREINIGDSENFSELIAACEYESDSNIIIRGFRLWQKKYAYKNVVIQMVIVIIALAIQIVNICFSGENYDASMSYFLAVVCVIIGVYIMIRPHRTLKKLERSIKELNGSVYRTEIYTDKIKIETLYSEYNDDNNPPKPDDVDDEIGDNTEDGEDVIPATVIHTDNSTVDIVDAKEFYLVYVKKVNMFVIPKSAFKQGETDIVKERLSAIMGARYRLE